MNRCEWEADAAAHRRGFANRHELFAHLAANGHELFAHLAAERRRAALKTAGRTPVQIADDNQKVGAWIAKFEAARQSNCARNITK